LFYCIAKGRALLKPAALGGAKDYIKILLSITRY
jgi:hypothetical protein